MDAVLEAAAALGEGREITFEDGAGIGVSSPKYRAFERAIGRKPFIDDLRFDGMVHGALRFSDHPRARFLSMDLDEAGKAPGAGYSLPRTSPANATWARSFRIGQS